MRRIEAGFFADDAQFEELEIAEDELIDAYVRQELSDEEKQKFRARLMTSPRIVERVNFAQALAEKTSAQLLEPREEDPQTEPSPRKRTPESKTWWEKFFVADKAFPRAVLACSALIVFGVVILGTGWMRLRSESIRLAAERELIERQKENLEKQSKEQQARADQQAADFQREREQLAEAQKQFEDQQHSQKPEVGTPSFGTIFISLLPGGVRGAGGDSELVLRPGTSTAVLKLGLESNDYPNYQVSVRKGATVVWNQIRLRPRQTRAGAVLAVSVPARLLTPGDYDVFVEGTSSTGQAEGVSNYKVRVVRKSE